MLRSQLPGSLPPLATETRPGCFHRRISTCAGHGYHILVAGIELRRRRRGAVIAKLVVNRPISLIPTAVSVACNRLMAAVFSPTSGCAANSAHYMLTGRTLFRLAGTTQSWCDAKAGISMDVRELPDLEVPLRE